MSCHTIYSTYSLSFTLLCSFGFLPIFIIVALYFHFPLVLLSCVLVLCARCCPALGGLLWNVCAGPPIVKPIYQERVILNKCPPCPSGSLTPRVQGESLGLNRLAYSQVRVCLQVGLVTN